MPAASWPRIAGARKLVEPVNVVQIAVDTPLATTRTTTCVVDRRVDVDLFDGQWLVRAYMKDGGLHATTSSPWVR